MKVILAAGGSGGHIFPSVALAAELEKRGAEVLFVSSKRQLDMSLLEPTGYRCFFLSVNPMPRKPHPVKLAVFFFKLVSDVFASARIMFRERPDAVVGFGGYSSGTISLCAKLSLTPLVIHEQNYFPGRANVILSGMADRVALSFEGTEKYFPRAKGRTAWTGNPLRTERLSTDREKARERIGLAHGGPTVLVMGGSQGASFLNKTASEAVRSVSERIKGIRVVHLTGKADYESILRFYEDNGIAARVFSFLDRMEDAYAVSDIAISRSGASAVFELAYYGMPMILVPYPSPKNNQWTNAKFFEERGAAVFKDEKELTADALAQELERMMSDGSGRVLMSEAALSLAVPDAAKRLAEEVLKLASKNKRSS